MPQQTLSATLVPADGTAAEASSCGLDFWHSAAGLRWTCCFLRAEPAMLNVCDGLNNARLLCLLRRLPGGLRLASAYPYGRIEGDAGLWWRAHRTITAALRRSRVVRLEIPFCGEYAAQVPTPMPSLAHVRLAHQLDAIRHVFDLPPQGADLESCFHPNIRWAIRKAVRSGYTVRRARADETDMIQSIYAATMRAKGAPVNYGPERWQGMLHELASRETAHVFVGENAGRPAGIAAVVDGVCSRHFVQLAVPPEFHSSRVGELLVAEALRDARDRGLRFFDFMASPVADKGLIAFKAKWGTRAEPIRHVVMSGMPLLAPLVDAGRWLIRNKARWHAE